MNPLLSKFIIPLIIVSIILTVIMGYVISAQIKDSELSRAQRITAQQISSEAGEHIPKDAFLATDPSEYNEDFEHFVDIVMNSEVIKIKILNDRGSIIYSTSKGDIGMISLSKGVKGALSGKDMVEISDPSDEPENKDLAAYDELLEIYVPVKFEDKVYGVVEAYYILDYINKDITKLNSIVISLISAFIFILIVYVFLLNSLSMVPKT